MKKIFFFAFSLGLMIAVTVLLFSCSEKQKVLAVKAHPEGWLDAASEKFHGKAVLETGAANCQSCHGQDYAGGTAKVACSSCHALYPHPQGWSAQTAHGAAILANLYPITSCQECHGTDYTGGTSQVSCFSCHPFFPHLDAWIDPATSQFHGKTVVDSLAILNECQLCHGSDYKGGTSQLSCSTCHQSFPHPENWRNADQHGPSIVNKTFTLDNCRFCHSSNFTGGNTRVSCLTCHSQYPHAAGWMSNDSPNFHGKAASVSEANLQQCQACHGADYKGGISQVSCLSCHGAYPHPSGWANYDQHGLSLVNHVYNVESCKTCHGADFTGGSSQVSCLTCHSQYPHAASWMSNDSPSFHGKVAIVDANKQQCQTCHGADYKGGISQVSCVTCHASYPHSSNWANYDQHGLALVNQTYSVESCKTCHGADFTGGSSQVSCLTCHSQYPHAASWMSNDSPSFHGKVAKENNNKQQCQVCHGADYKGGISQVSCLTCHASYPHSSNWANYDQHGLALVNQVYTQASCKPCHGENLAGGTSQVSCFSCHSQYPHGSGWINEESGNFHGVLAENATNRQQCQACHGADFKGGISNVSCFTCHNDFPHATGFANVASQDFHGNFIRQTANWEMATCRSCHGDDYGGDHSSTKNCLTCHSQPHGPEACNTCHGNADNSAPPKDMSGNEATTFVGVGAHQAHMVNTNLTTSYLRDCRTCHIQPQTNDEAGHLDATPESEVLFNLVASDSGKVNPVWDRNTATCNNVYCHGNFVFKKDDSANPWGYAFGETEIKGNSPTLVWTAVGSGAADCGTCHGLPPTGHIGVFSCELCHGNVVDGSNHIVDKSLHINGRIDLQLPAGSALQQLLRSLNLKEK